MTNKNSFPQEDRKHLREFLSYNPFFQEMESHLHKMAYGKSGYSDEHLCLEQMWLLAILQMPDEDIFFHDFGTVPSLLGDDKHYDYATCYYLMTVKCHLMHVRYRGISEITDEEAAWQCVENEFHRLDFNDENTWHFLYANFIRTLYLNHNIHFANGKRNYHRTDSSQSDAELHIQHKD